MLQLTLFNNVHSALFRNKSIEKNSKSSCYSHIKKKEKRRRQWFHGFLGQVTYISAITIKAYRISNWK